MSCRHSRPVSYCVEKTLRLFSPCPYGVLIGKETYTPPSLIYLIGLTARSAPFFDGHKCRRNGTRTERHTRPSATCMLNSTAPKDMLWVCTYTSQTLYTRLILVSSPNALITHLVRLLADLNSCKLRLILVRTIGVKKQTEDSFESSLRTYVRKVKQKKTAFHQAVLR